MGEALRLLIENATATEMPTEHILRAAELIRQAAAPLGEHRRGRFDTASADDLLGGIRLYNPVTGEGSAFAPPVDMHREGDLAIGTCTLGRAFEGPPSFAHGGVSAMLLDQMLGYAVTTAGHPGMTVRLDTVYRSPVPLYTPLRMTASITEVNGRRVTATGAITTTTAPTTALVEATGLFVALRSDQAKRLFGPVLDRSA
ncbi:thioesterase [Actinoplanes couchii]|uniref:Acyl-coenzyme A thioesterase THEM4 n=1 Tax=Actinoplanes couchii TaxID=403638 RepID=A0ABQ3XF29_9ACTN|nr:thioesterase [Actinoplanes couchii]